MRSYLWTSFVALSVVTALTQTPLSGRPFDAQFDADIRGFFSDFYHVELTDQQLRRLVAAP
ncbi:MAG TPA: hypothetical protein VFO58_15525 [Vicinamibacterales bacterium]|nr:hypothetical protein [Vicinamibacterales bacterium]